MKYHEISRKGHLESKRATQWLRFHAFVFLQKNRKLAHGLGEVPQVFRNKFGNINMIRFDAVVESAFGQA